MLAILAILAIRVIRVVDTVRERRGGLAQEAQNECTASAAGVRVWNVLSVCVAGLFAPASQSVQQVSVCTAEVCGKRGELSVRAQGEQEHLGFGQRGARTDKV